MKLPMVTMIMYNSLRFAIKGNRALLNCIRAETLPQGSTCTVSYIDWIAEVNVNIDVLYY